MLTGKSAFPYAERGLLPGNMNLTEVLDRTASDWPKKTALIEGENVVSYAELAEKTHVFAAHLRELRLPAGSRIGLCFPNSVHYVALTFALWRMNAVVVPGSDGMHSGGGVENRARRCNWMAF